MESPIPGGSMQLLSRVLSHHGKGNHPCPLCDIAPLEDSVMGHLLANHCGELGLVQEADLELILCQLVDLDINFLEICTVFLSHNPCHRFVFVCISCSLWALSINL